MLSTHYDANQSRSIALSCSDFRFRLLYAVLSVAPVDHFMENRPTPPPNPPNDFATVLHRVQAPRYKSPLSEGFNVRIRGMSTVEIGRRPLEGVSIFHHWALCYNDVWFELKGTGKSDNGPNKIQTTRGSSSYLGASSWKVVGGSGATLSDIKEFNKWWLTKFPTYDFIQCNCQLYVVHLLQFLCGYQAALDLMFEMETCKVESAVTNLPIPMLRITDSHAQAQLELRKHQLQQGYHATSGWTPPQKPAWSWCSETTCLTMLCANVQTVAKHAWVCGIHLL